MSALTPEARALLSRARAVPRSTSADRERIRGMLAGRLAPVAPDGGGSTSGSPSAAPTPHISTPPVAASVIGGLARAIATTTAGALVAGGLLWGVLPTTDAPAPIMARTGVEASLATAFAAPPPRLVDPFHRAFPISAPVPIPVPVPISADVATPIPVVEAPPAPNASIAAEVAALRRANAALSGGDASSALADLDELAQAQPTGVLVEERLALRALSLCAAGRVEEARAVAATLFALAPDSPHVDRVRASCAGAP